jgi:hypothetical protein
VTHAPTGTMVGVSLGHRTVSEADHWILSLDPLPTLACTHFVTAPFRHVAISLQTPLTYETAPPLQAAADAVVSQPGGRAVTFPGADRLVGSLTVAEALSSSAIDRIEILGGSPASPDSILDTRNFVRPVFRDAALVLTVMPAAGDVLVPFEVQDPTPCCAAHS